MTIRIENLDRTNLSANVLTVTMDYEAVQAIQEAFVRLDKIDNPHDGKIDDIRTALNKINWTTIFDLVGHGFVSGFQKEQIADYINRRGEKKDNDNY